jgi:hypothetical protein
MRNLEQEEAAQVYNLVDELKHAPGVVSVKEPEMTADGKLKITVYIARPINFIDIEIL